MREFNLIRNHTTPNWHEHASAILFAAFCLCAIYLLVRPKTDQTALIYCPKCKTVGGHQLASPYRRSVNPTAWHFGGVFLSIFYSGTKEERFRCRNCHELFYSHTSSSRGYGVLFLLVVALIVNHIWSDFADFWNPANSNQ